MAELPHDFLDFNEPTELALEMRTDPCFDYE
jgi:hypothetical protein